MTKLQSLTAKAILLLVFPGFFYYHALAAFEFLKVPLPLGGWWSWANLLGAAVLGPMLVIAAFRSRNPALIAALLFTTIVATVGLWHFRFGTPWQRDFVLLEEVAKLCAAVLCLSGIGYFLRFNGRFTGALVVCFVLIGVLTPFLVRTDPFSPLDADRWRFQQQVANYAAFANPVAVLGLLLMGWLEDRKKQAAIASLTFISLFLLGARFELIGFVVVAGLWAGLMIFQHGAITAKGAMIAVSVCVAGVGVAVLVGANSLGRYAELLDVMNAGSFKERLSMFEHGLSDLAERPLAGSYAGQVFHTGEFGHYMHNVLSVWRQFGLVAFLIYITLVGTAVVIPLRHLRSLTPLHASSLFVGGYSLVLMAIGKSVFWPIPALAWGIAAAAMQEERDATSARHRLRP